VVKEIQSKGILQYTHTSSAKTSKTFSVWHI